MARRKNPAVDAVIIVTDAQPPHSEDLSLRMIRYAWMMSIRIVCFVLAVLTPSPWRWMLVFGAVFLPFVAVIQANTKRRATRAMSTSFVRTPQPDT